MSSTIYSRSRIGPRSTPKVSALIDDIERRNGFATVKLACASGLMLVVWRAG
jgi:hypothetical protein